MLYYIVENAGYENEQEIASYPNFQAAVRALRQHYDAEDEDELHVQIMVKREDGVLTNEF